MADPSTEQTPSVPVPPTRAARLLKVVADIESIRDSGPLSDNTSAHVEMFLDRARDPSTDIELLELATMMLKQAQDTKAMASRVRKDVARATAGATTGQQTVDGIHLDELSYPAIAAELDKASQWNEKRSNGDTTAAPAMPELERLAAMGKTVAARYPTMERNFRPPRLEDHLGPDGEVDWRSVRDACEDTKTRLRDSHRAGKLTEDRLHIFLKLIDAWLSLHVPKKLAADDDRRG
jgi:hypothetical protein